MLKALRMGQQNGRCAYCGDELPLKYSELDCKNAADAIPDKKRNWCTQNAIKRAKRQDAIPDWNFK